MQPRSKAPSAVARQWREAMESCSSARCPHGHGASGGGAPRDVVVMGYPFLQSSDEALVHVTPSPRRVLRETGGDRVVGLLVVRPGVPVRRVIGTGDPAAGPADHKARLAVLGRPASRLTGP